MLNNWLQRFVSRIQTQQHSVRRRKDLDRGIRRRSVSDFPRHTQALENRLVLSGVQIEVATNGADADAAPGPSIVIGDPVNWTYEVTNTGVTPVSNVRVTDDGGTGLDPLPTSSSEFIPATGRKDTVHDAKREVLYISTCDGDVLRYDLAAKSFLSPFNLGGALIGMDLSPDQNTLVVADTDEDLGRGVNWIHVVDLMTGAARKIEFPLVSLEGGTFSVAFTTDTTVLVTSTFRGSGWVPMREVDLTDDSYSVIESVRQNTMLTATTDLSAVAYAEANISSGEFGRYRVSDRNFVESETNRFAFEIGVSRDGGQFAVPSYSSTYVYDSSFQLIDTIGIYADESPIGLVYSPVDDVVYFAWFDRDDVHASIDVYDTDSLTRIATIDSTPRFDWIGNAAFVEGRLKVSRDGRWLFATVDDGVMAYASDDFDPAFTAGDTNGNGLLDPGETWQFEASGTATAGQYGNAARVTAINTADAVVSDTDSSHYTGVAASDVVAASLDGSDNLVIEEVGGGTDDGLTISFDGTDFTITASGGETIGAPGIPGASGSRISSITVPAASISGSQIIINAGDGDDTLTVDFGDGSLRFSKEIVFNGEGQSSSPNGDTLVLTGTGTFDDATFGFTNETDGTVEISGNPVITYTGLEPITSTIDATNVTLNYSTTAETITVSDAGGGQTTVDSDVGGETVTFNNPTGTLTINAGDTGDDVIDIASLAASYPASVVIDGEGGTDTVTVDGDVVLNGKDLSVTADTITVDALVSTGGGNISLSSSGDIAINLAVSTGGGSLSLTADSDGDNSGTLSLVAPSMAGIAELAKLTASDPNENARFGDSLAIDGETAVIGAVYNDHAGGLSGSAYVFTRSGSTWTQQAILTASDAAAGDQFGVSVAVSGDTIVVGANKDDEGGSSSGSAYVFTRSGAAWTQQAKLTADDAIMGDQFGRYLDVKGDTAIVGGGRSVYVFSRSGPTWSQTQTLAADDETSFGRSVSLSGDTAVIGTLAGGPAGASSGSAFVFTRSGGTWSQQAKLTADDSSEGDWFGFAVSLDGDTAVIGAHNDASQAGSAYVFTRSGSTWTQEAKIVADDVARRDQFGLAVSVAGDVVAVGSPGDDDGGAVSGSVYLFTRSGNVWSQQAKLAAADAAEGNGLGAALAFDGATLVAGAPFDDDGQDDSGAAYIFGDSPASAGGAIDAGSGALSLTAATFDMQANLAGTGPLTIAPSSASRDIGIGGGAGDLLLDNATLAQLAAGFSSITIGDVGSGTGAVDVDTATFSSDVTIVGGSITVDGLNAGANIATLTARTGAISTAAGAATNPVDVTTGTLIVNGSVAPGASPRQLVVDGDVTFDASDEFVVELNGTTPGTGHDQLRVQGNSRVVTLGDATLTLSTAAVFASDSEFVVVDNVDSSSTVNGTFAGLPEGAAVTFGSNVGTISYAGGADGNDVVITADNTAPSTTSFTRETPAGSPTNADVVVFRATFDEGVTGVDTADFAVNGTTTATITGVSAVSGSEYDVTVSGGDLSSLNGVVGLDFAGSVSITDLSGNALSAGEPATDETYLIDNVAPSTTSFTRQSPMSTPTNADELVFRATFNEDVTGVDAGDFAINGTTTATVTGVAPVSGSEYDVTISGGDLADFNGVVGLDLAGSGSITDPAGNALPGSEPATDETYLVDNDAPSATSFTRQIPMSTPTGADVLVFRATFSEDVTGVDAGDFAVNGTTTATVSNVSAVSGSQYDVTVSGGDLPGFDGIVGLDFAGSVSIVDFSGNMSPGDEPTTDETLRVDNVAPSTMSFTRQHPAGSPTNADALIFRATFDEDVTGVDAADFAVDGTTTATVTSVSAVSGSRYDVTVSGGDLAGFNGVVGLDFAVSVSITDLIGQSLPGTEPATDETFRVDNVAPSTVSFTRETPALTPTNADVLVFRATFSEDVASVDPADFAVSGSTTATVTNVSAASGSQYDVTVSGGDLAGFEGVVGLDFAGSVSVTDLAGNSLPSTEPATDETYTLENVVPSTVSFTRETPASASTNADVLVFRATFSEDVISVDQADFVVASSTTATVTNVSALSGSQYDVTVSGGDLADFDGVVGLDFSGSLSITDGAGNVLPNVEPTTDETYLVDNTDPSTTSFTRETPAPTSTNADVLVFRVTFSEIVADVDSADFTVNATTTATVANVSMVSGSQYDVTVSGGDLAGFNGVVGLNFSGSVGITDLVGNMLPGSEPGTDEMYLVDNDAPSTTSFNRQTPAGTPTNADAVVFRATFSEAVSGVDTTDFVVNGTTTATVANVSIVSGSQYDVTVSGGDLAGFNGVVGLDFSGSVEITDLAGNTLPGTEPTVDETYTLENDAPSTTSFVRQTPASTPTNADVLVFQVTFSEVVTGVDAADFAVNGTTTATVTDVSAVSGSQYDVTVSGGDLANFNGVVGLDFAGTLSSLLKK